MRNAALECGMSYLDELIANDEVEIVRDGPKFIRVVASSLHRLVERRAANSRQPRKGGT